MKNITIVIGAACILGGIGEVKADCAEQCPPANQIVIDCKEHSKNNYSCKGSIPLTGWEVVTPLMVSTGKITVKDPGTISLTEDGSKKEYCLYSIENQNVQLRLINNNTSNCLRMGSLVCPGQEGTDPIMCDFKQTSKEKK